MSAAGLFCPACVARERCAFHSERKDALEDVSREEGKKRGTELLNLIGGGGPQAQAPPAREWRPQHAPGSWGNVTDNQWHKEWRSAPHHQHMPWAQSSWTHMTYQDTYARHLHRPAPGLIAKAPASYAARQYFVQEVERDSDEASTDAGSSQPEVLSVHDTAEPWYSGLAA